MKAKKELSLMLAQVQTFLAPSLATGQISIGPDGKAQFRVSSQTYDELPSRDGKIIKQIFLKNKEVGRTKFQKVMTLTQLATFQ